MKNFDLYKLRVGFEGSTSQDRINKIKEKSLKQVIKQNPEKIKYNNIDYEVLITFNSKIAAPLEINLSEGQLIYRHKFNNYWLIKERNYQESAYFSGTIVEAPYKINWKIGDVKYETYAALDKITNDEISKSINNFYINLLNNSLKILIPLNDDTKTLKLYDKLMINNRVWEIKNIDNITLKNILILSLEEILKDKYNDNVNENIAREEQVLVKNSEISGVQIITLLTGLTQTYKINNPNVNGTWTFDNNFGVIKDIDNEKVIIEFNYKKFGKTKLQYVVDGNVVSELEILVKSLI